MGDVILLLPVIQGLVASNPDIEVYLITQKGFFSIFQNIERLHLIEIDLKGKNKGFLGLYKLFCSVKDEINPDMVFDLHRVLRSYVLDVLFFMFNFKVWRFNKGTFIKYLVIHYKKLTYMLPGTVDRYAEVFIKAGYTVQLAKPPLFVRNSLSVSNDNLFVKPIIIGIAPFAKHKQKIWSTDRVEAMIKEINIKYDAQIVLFGGGHSELSILRRISMRNSNCIVSADHFAFSDEIGLMSKLTLMVSMDSANMHLSAMAGVPTVSIWGATHPVLGFAPYNQPKENIIQYVGNQLNCRPCSVYGNKKCIYTNSIRCMEYISVDIVIDRINEIINNTKMDNPSFKE